MAIEIGDNYVKVNTTIATPPNNAPSFNRIGLFTTDSPSAPPVSGFTSYTRLKDVQRDYGSSSSTAQLASVMFNQAPNVITGGGSLVIAPINATSATAGFIETADVSTNLSSFLTVTNGYLRLNIDGVEKQVSGFNFTGFTSTTAGAEIATAISQAFPDVTVSYLSSPTTLGFTFTSKTYGTASSVTAVPAVGPLPIGAVDLSTVGYFNLTPGTGGGLAVSGAPASGVTVIEALESIGRSMKIQAFFTNLLQEDGVILANGAYAQGQGYIYMQSISSTLQLQTGGLASQNLDAGQTKCRLVFYSATETANNFTAAYLGWFFSTLPTQAKITVSQRTLVGLPFDPVVNQSIANLCNATGVDAYPLINPQGNAGIYSSNWNRTGWQFNVIYNSQFIAYTLQNDVNATISANGGGVPSTRQGLGSVLNVINARLSFFVASGFISTGILWSGQPPFGNPDNFLLNLFQFGFYTLPGNLANQNASSRVQRDQQLVNVAYQLTGAIEGITLNLYAQQ